MSPIEILLCLLVYSLTACLVWRMEKISWIRALVKCTVLGAAFYIFYTVAQGRMHVHNGGTLRGIAPVLELAMSEDERAEFPVGAEVEIVFGYASTLTQFFMGAEPLVVMKTQVICSDAQLEHDVRLLA